MDDPNQVLTEIFDPLWRWGKSAEEALALQEHIEKSANPNAAELLARADSRSRSGSEATGAPKTGRPKKKNTPLAQFNPKNPRSVIGIKGDVIESGSVLHVELSDGRKVFIVLKESVQFDVIG